MFRRPKVAADAIALGGAIYRNSTDGLATVTATGDTPIGIAVEAAPASAGTVAVLALGLLSGKRRGSPAASAQLTVAFAAKERMRG